MTNRRMYELIENAPKTGKGPTIWAWPQLTEYLKTAAQPVAGPWPPHQEPRPLYGDSRPPLWGPVEGPGRPRIEGFPQLDGIPQGTDLRFRPVRG